MTDQQTIPEKPKTVVRAIQLLWAYLALSLINTALQWNQVIADVKSKSTPEFSMNPELFVFIIWAVVFSFLLWLIIKISSSRNWARITFLTLTVLGIPFSIFYIVNNYNNSTNWFFLIEVFIFILTLSSCVLLFVPSSNAWFREIKLQRLRRKLS